MNKIYSRREGRYQRRKEKRKKKLENRNNSIGTLNSIYNYKDLYKTGKKCCKNVRWKASTQNFEIHLFSGTARRRRLVIDKSWRPDKYNHFILNERGKVRPIDAPRIQDRQIHKIFTTNALLPLYIPGMIYNNGASLPGKGFDFSRKMLMKELHYHFNKYGREGKIILLDFRKFFPSVSHQQLFYRHDRIILNKEIKIFANNIVRSIGKTYGLPLGVEPSQAEMIAFPSSLDNYVKCQLSLKGAGHYMDDYYILVPPSKDAKIILKKIIQKAEELKLTISKSKTRIIPLTKSFKFCKLKYKILQTGKIIVRGCRDSMKRARRKIRMFQKRIALREMSYEDLWTSINGIIAYFQKYNDHNRVLKLRRLFFKMFDFSCENINNFRAQQRRINEIHSI